MEKRELIEKGTERKDTLMINFEDNINCCIHLSSGQKRFPLFYLLLSPSLLPFLRKITIGVLKLISDVPDLSI